MALQDHRTGGAFRPILGHLHPVYSLDLAFAVPLIALSGVWLILGYCRGSAIAAAGLAFLVILGLSVLAIFVFQAAAGIPVEVAPIAIFGSVTATAAVLLVLV